MEISSLPKTTLRRRGDHSVKCSNPTPTHERPAGYKKLPGAFGRLYRISKQKNCAKHPYFVQLRRALGRSRSYRPERVGMINAVFSAVLDCLDLATGMTTKSLEQIAQDLNVTDSRMSRVINEVFIPAGLMYVHPADRKQFEVGKDYNFGMVWDAAHGIWFPKCLVVTDEFFRVAGADEKLLEKIKNQAAEHLQLSKHGLSAPGEVLTLSEARNRRRDRAFKISWEKRKSAARVQRTKQKLSQLSLDDRQFFIAEKLIKQRPDYYDAVPLDTLQRDIWTTLHDLSMAVYTPSPDKPH